MLIFQVGGSVRDELLGINPSDSDFVVVNATIEEFILKFPNAKRIGKSFPVFSVDGKEYAFARKERKISSGYTGFEVESNPEITIEEDLLRRDITINAIAINVETGEITDPYNGIKDLNDKRIVHVSNAFTEDPLRVYRVARFAARFHDFKIDPKTLELMRSLKSELNFLSEERVWMECLKALSSKKASRFFNVLNYCDLLDIHFPEIAKLSGVPAGPEKYHPDDKDAFDHTMKALDRLSDHSQTADPVLNFAVLCHDLGKGLTEKEIYPHHYGHDKAGERAVKEFCKKIKIPNQFKKAALMSAKYHMMLPKIMEMRPAKVLNMLKDINGFPSGGIAGFLQILYADSGTYPENIARFIEKITPALEMKLPEQWRDLGKKSSEKLMQIKIEKYKELSRSV
ncbi:MAG TPA: HD domain-containing protein [bacterium]|nr:HD domain-containing protein [bacterium]HPS30080.1 HD domain-containing protein [bacterium]